MAMSMSLEFRRRYYETEGAWDNLDQKEWGAAATKSSAAESIEKVRLLTRTLSIEYGSQVYEVLRGDRTLKEFFDDFSSQPFVHMKSGAEAEEYLRKIGAEVPR
jgi:hypothetical protein